MARFSPFFPLSLFVCCAVIVLSGCLGTRYLGKDEYLLYNQKIKGNQHIGQGRLEAFYQQKSNRRLPLLPAAPYVYLYHLGETWHDTAKVRQKTAQITQRYEERISKAEEKDKQKKARRLKKKRNRKLEHQRKVMDEGNGLMRLGEPVAVLDSVKVINTQEQILNHIRSKGFFHAEVSHQISRRLRTANVRYQVRENEPYTIGMLLYRTDDININRLLKESERQRILVENERYDEDKLKAERDRMEKLLRNNGYYDFSKQYIQFQIDTTFGNKQVLVRTVISKPAARGFHKIFRLDSVIFTTDAEESGSQNKRNFRLYNGITYRYFTERYSKKILDRRVFIYPDSLYGIDNTTTTQRMLANLDMFKFININYDTTAGRFVANIYTSPLQKYSTTNETGVNVTQGFPGPFYNIGLKNRNPFNGLEILEFNGRFGIEGVASASNTDNIYQSREFGLNTSLLFPQFMIPVGNRTQSYLGRLNPKTRLSANYQFTNRPEYIRRNLSLAMAYTWQKKTRYTMTSPSLMSG
ncbi:MAG: hypothetical protein HC842_01485 [Cytophagales bacterium]|nr:hypothetical protein [Cytophagales bacterium]